MFDTAAAVRSAIPQIAFVAFYSDVEHEVAIVDSGYRVTLTYNLYLVDVPSAHPLGIVPTKDPLNDVKSALSPLLVDPKFLPTGGLLGFQLAHKYPFKIGSTDFEDLKKRLKGSDAAIDRICQDMSLMTSLKALHVYTPEYQGPTSALVDTFLELENYQYEGDELMELFKEHGATFVYSFPEKIRGGDDDSDDESDDESDGPGFVPIFWIKQGNACNSVEQPYMAYGNQAELDHIYVELCLVAEIKPFTERNSTMAI
ncbi:hypothetical protein CVT26_015767 [Gymnopilus dilepis]|uniref:Prolyl 4-hydroxylase alpha subunit Fe(2+) 2OG dioxygenase domain-containing protein n=1 Tax=Gymnopilus dilepis TaxID=231916 RepID=A0A409W4J4_9AGAR|nr:hypothetical protein CVT26_015767 [Gymnopilus dilepis]